MTDHIRGVAPADRSAVFLELLAQPQRLQIDINIRTPEGLTPATYIGSAPETGEPVIAFEPEDQIRAHAIVEKVVPERQLAFLRVDWESMDDDQGPSSIIYSGSLGHTKPSTPTPSS